MQVIRLKYDAKCADCGARLPAGTQARIYERQDGTRVIYGLNCHGYRGKARTGRRSEGNTAKEEAEPKPLMGNSEALDALAEIQRGIWTLVEIVKAAFPQAAEEVLSRKKVEEAAEKPASPGMTKKDWARFWVQVRELGLSNGDLHEIYGVESVKEIIKTPDDAAKILADLRRLSEF